MFCRPAVEVKQGNLKLYLTYITPDDLFNVDGFYTVDKLEPRAQEGFQRILDERRAVRLARHLIEAGPKGYAHLPTTVFLATDKPVTFHESSGVLEFDQDVVCPFSVVDGQHRIEGLRRAFEKDSSLQNFRLPVTLATELNDIHQMYHFFIVNTTQVPVEPSLRQQITRRFTDMHNIQDLPYKPYWLESEVSAGRDARALRVVEFLNEHPNSPLLGRVLMANDPKSPNKIKQSSLVDIFKKEFFTASNPLLVQESDQTRQHNIILNYFCTVDDIFVNGRDRNATVVYKNNGLFLFITISKWVFNAVFSSTRDFTKASLYKTITNALDYLADAYQDMASPDWWMPGAYGASMLNRSNAHQYADAFQRALAQSQQKPDVQI